MGDPRRSELDREMDSYLSAKKGCPSRLKSFFSRKKKASPSTDVPLETYGPSDVPSGPDNNVLKSMLSVLPFGSRSNNGHGPDLPPFDENGNIIGKPKEVPVPVQESKDTTAFNEFDREERHVEKSESGTWLNALLSKIDLFYKGEPYVEMIEEEVHKPMEPPQPSKGKLEKELINLSHDMKTLAKISAKILKTLPKKDFEKFKKSSLFSEYKEILMKNKIIK